MRYIIKHIPNMLTVSRILLLFPILSLIIEPGNSRIISFILFIVSAISDALDGYIARRFKLQSKVGAFLDPLADKILINSLFVCFVYVDPSVFPFWLIWLIAVREFSVTIIRIGGIYSKEEVKTLMVGKLKTVFQFATIIIIYALFIIKDFFATNLINFQYYLQQNLMNSEPLWKHLFGLAGSMFVLNLPTIFLSIVTFLSIYSGIVYIYKNKNFFL